MYRQTSNISCSSVDNTLVDHSDVAGASPFGTAPTTSFSTTHLASVDWAKATTRQDMDDESFGIRCTLYQRYYGTYTFKSILCLLISRTDRFRSRIHNHWKERVVSLIERKMLSIWWQVSSLAAPDVVILTTSIASSEENFIKLTIFLFLRRIPKLWS